MSSNHPVVHFEMPYEDAERVGEFYSRVFGWEMNALGAGMGDYVTAETTESTNGRSTTPGVINGGFFRKQPDQPDQYPSVVIAVGDIEAAMTAIAEAGGTVLGEPMDIPGVGKYLLFADSEGNRVSCLKPLM